MFRGPLLGSIRGMCDYITSAVHTVFSGSGVLTVSFSGLTEGDFVILGVACNSGSGVTGPAGWTAYEPADSAFRVRFYSRVLTAGDISLGSAQVSALNPGDVVTVAAYRGPRAATLKTSTASTNSDGISLAGFTMADNAVGVIAALWSNSYGAVGAPPSPLEQRVSGASIYRGVVADVRYADNYPEAAMNWSGLVNSPSVTHRGFLLELTK